MKKTIIMMTLVATLVGCCTKKPHYENVDAYPVKQGSLDEMVYTPEKTTFSVWSPNADSVYLNIYADATTAAPLQTLTMCRQKDGSWSKTVKGDLNGQFYTFQVVEPSSRWKLHETPGIFAKAVGVNGRRAAIIDLAATNPDGWNEDVRPAFAGAKDAIIYEMHHRDMTIHATSGVENKGKFVGWTEHGTKSAEGFATGIDHLVELGVTHVQILPSYDYGSVDETRLSDNKYNWGYDPVNYNAPDGGYSTNPYDPASRIREMKQMIQALHKAGIRVIMDVVYNHTFNVENSNFTQTAPDYFYRLTENGNLGNASGCGNETASERAMMRKFIVESCRYWIEEYHMDGFRFDLMGIHDVETMNQVRAMLDSIDPSLLLYGEGWAAGGPLYPGDQLAMKANMQKLPGIGAFCDDMRDALRGPFSDNNKGAFLIGEQGHEESIKFGLVGCIAHPEVDMEKVNYSKQAWTSQPTQSINYVSCHDDMMLTDRLKANKKLKAGELQKLSKLAQTAVLTSQGMPFLWCGEEIARDKKGVHNSYCSPDDINAIDWSLKAENLDLFAYYQGLIAMRKAHPAFHMGDADLVRENLHFLEAPAGVVAYQLNGEVVGDEWKSIVVVLNSQTKAQTVALPAGEYHVAVADGKCPTTAQGLRKGSVKVAAQSAMVLYQL